MTILKFIATLFALIVLGAPATLMAQIPVTDVGAFAQLLAEVNTLGQQLDTARQNLSQAQQQYQSISGGRGMEQLLSGTVRNYLPTNTSQLQAALSGSDHASAISTDIRAAVEANSVLTAQQIGSMSPEEQQAVRGARGNAALQQAVAQEALANASKRFGSIQTLIDAIPSATDQKGILELTARISAEEAMLQNEQTKLNMLNQAAIGAEWARRQRSREYAIADIGSLRHLSAMGL